MSFAEEPKWPKSLPDLERLDQLLRCGICYDFVKTALMTPCSHNFCSLCIRKYMQYKTSCPACLVETVETQLKNNRVLDELVKIIERLKLPLCKALNGHELGLPTSSEQPKVTPESTFSEKPKDVQVSTVIEKPKCIQTQDSEVRQDKSVRSQPTQSIFSSLETSSSLTTTQESSTNSNLSDALKILENNIPSHNGLILERSKQFSAKLPGGQEQKIPPSTGRISPEVSLVTVLDKPQTFPSSSSLPASPQKPPKRTIADMFIKSPVKKSGLSNQRPQNPVPASPSVITNLNMVSCPVCSVSIPNAHINQHLDACLKNEKIPPKPSTKIVKSRQPLPKLVYRLLKEKDLRLKLADQKLSTQGDRKTLEKRYQRYLVLYNSECDKAEPRPVPEIVKQLEREEREENLSGCKTWASLASQVDRKSDPKDIEKAQKQYLNEHKSSFDALIAAARQRKPKKVEPPSCTVTSGSDTSNSTPSIPTASTSTASSTAQPTTSEVKEKCTLSSTSADQPASRSPEQSDSRQSTSPSLLSAVYGPQSPSLLSQNSPTVKSPILGRKRLFPPVSTKISTPPALDALDNSPILISDDSNSTVFSEGDLSQIDIAISQHNSATEVKGDNKSVEFSSGDLAQIDTAISQHNNSAIGTIGDNSSAEFSSGDLAQIDNAITQHMNESQMEVDENSVDPWEMPVKLTGRRVLDSDSSDSDGAFKVQRRRSSVPLPPSPVVQRQRRSRKRQVPEQSNEPRRSSRKKPKSK